MLKNSKDIVFKIFFPTIPVGAVRCSCPIRLVPTYILPAKERRLLGKFQPDSFKTMGSETSPSLRCMLLT